MSDTAASPEESARKRLELDRNFERAEVHRSCRGDREACELELAKLDFRYALEDAARVLSEAADKLQTERLNMCSEIQRLVISLQRDAMNLLEKSLD